MQNLKSLRFDLEAEHTVSSEVSSRPIEARDKAELHRVDACDENDRNSRGRGLGCKGRDKAWCDDHSHPMLEQISRQGGQPIDLIRRPPILDCHVPALDVTGFGETPSEASETDLIGFRRPFAQIADHRDDCLLRTRRERPRGR